MKLLWKVLRWRLYEGLGMIVDHGSSTNEEKIESKKDEIKEEKKKPDELAFRKYSNI